MYYTKSIAISGKLTCKFLAVQHWNMWKHLF